MPIFKDTVMINDRPYDRPVEVTVTAPADMNILNLQELAEKAWRSVNKTITIGRMTVKVRAFRRHPDINRYKQAQLRQPLVTQ